MTQDPQFTSTTEPAMNSAPKPNPCDRMAAMRAARAVKKTAALAPTLFTDLEQMAVDNSPERIYPVTHREPFFNGSSARWCGPAAISIITGRTTECAAAWINFQRSNPPHFQVRGTDTAEVRYVLERLGWRLINHFDYTKLKGYDGSPNFRRLHCPTMASWIRSRTPAERKMTFLVVGSAHWMVVRGNLYGCGLIPELANTSESKYRRSRVTEVYRIAKSIGPLAEAIRDRRTDPMPPWERFNIPDRKRPWPKAHEIELAQHRITG